MNGLKSRTLKRNCIYYKVARSFHISFYMVFCIFIKGLTLKTPILYWQQITRTLIYSWELFAFELQGIKSYIKVLFCVLIYIYLHRQKNIFPDICELTQNNQGTRVRMWCLRVLIINNISRHLHCDWKHRRKRCSDTLKCTLQGKPFCVLYFFSKQHMHEYTQTYVTRVLVLLLSLFLAQHPHIHLVSRFPLWPRTCRNTHAHTRFHRLLQQIFTPRYTDTPNMIRRLFRDICLSVIHVIQRHFWESSLCSRPSGTHRHTPHRTPATIWESYSK